MAEKRIALGRTGRTAAANVKRLRETQRLSYAEMSRVLDGLGRPIATLGLSRIENGERRIDVDDLLALAQALGVSPLTLLMPTTETAEQPVEATGLGDVPAIELWHWLRTDLPLGATSADVMRNMEFQWKSKPPWHLPEIVDRAPMSPSDLRRIADEHEKKSPRGND
ncbi:helix-turn-helix domain-containing protein [Rhodococcus sp. KRD175]|uniref:helix-turn-helix domain-containing protein n=1 Tax=Rhodococcus sp. KRD175 TaxID=2729729 RepID=UPI0019D21516|nr:helix-turn-helix transcriptional regulator [Rhodococcus sp. KRD175]